MAIDANHSGAKAIIASVDSANTVGDLRAQCPTLEHFLLVGSPRSGWTSLPALMKNASPQTMILGPGASIAGCLTASASQVASQIQTIAEKKPEEGEPAPAA